MAAQVKFGQIVWAEITDANGIRKSRPAIVVTKNDRITPDGPLEVVAIEALLQNLISTHLNRIGCLTAKFGSKRRGIACGGTPVPL